MTPEQGRKWYLALLPIAQQGGPLLTLLLAVMMALAVWYLLGVIDSNRKVTVDLLERLLRCQDQKTDLLRACQP